VRGDHSPWPGPLCEQAAVSHHFQRIGHSAPLCPAGPTPVPVTELTRPCWPNTPALSTLRTTRPQTRNPRRRRPPRGHLLAGPRPRPRPKSAHSQGGLCRRGPRGRNSPKRRTICEGASAGGGRDSKADCAPFLSQIGALRPRGSASPGLRIPPPSTSKAPPRAPPHSLPPNPLKSEKGSTLKRSLPFRLKILLCLLVILGVFIVSHNGERGSGWRHIQESKLSLAPDGRIPNTCQPSLS